MKHIGPTCAAVCVLAALLGGVARADGVVRNSVSAVSSGRGGANIAHSDNGAVLLDNPAGILDLPGCGYLDVGVGLLITDLHYADPQNDVNADFQPFGLPDLSYNWKVPGGRWAAGIGVFAPAGFGGEWHMNAPPPLPSRAKYKSLGALGKVVPGLAWRATDRLSVGGTFGVGLSHIELEGPFFLQSGILRGLPTLLDLQATGAEPVWSVGMQYRLTECTTVGVAYTSDARFELDGSANVDAFGVPNPLGAGPLQSRYDASVDLTWPRSLGVGVKHCLSPCCRASLDVVWYDWSAAFDQVGLTLSNPSNPIFRLLAGPEVRDQFPLDWEDSISVRFGLEHALGCGRVLRVGYVHDQQTVPHTTLTPYIPATLEHTFTIGYGACWRNWRVDTAYQYAFGPTQHVEDSQVVGGDFSSSQLRSQTHWVFLNLSRPF